LAEYFAIYEVLYMSFSRCNERVRDREKGTNIFSELNVELLIFLKRIEREKCTCIFSGLKFVRRNMKEREREREREARTYCPC